MNIPLCRVGDHSNHGGVIISSPISNKYDNGAQIAVIGALHACPIPFHGVTPIISSPIVTVNFDNITAAMIGSVAGCGAVMNTGSPTTNITS